MQKGRRACSGGLWFLALLRPKRIVFSKCHRERKRISYRFLYPNGLLEGKEKRPACLRQSGKCGGWSPPPSRLRRQLLRSVGGGSGLRGA